MGSTNAESHKLQKYGVPLYGAGWVPYDHVIRSKLKPPSHQEDEDDKEEDQNGSNDEAVTDDSDEINSSYYVVLAGGGGEGNSGIRNAILLSHFHFASNSLSDQPFQDGNLRVFKWPSMEVVLNESQAHASMKDLSFSPDEKFLISLGNRGPGRVWDLTSSTVVTPLAKENWARFRRHFYYRFKQYAGSNNS